MIRRVKLNAEAVASHSRIIVVRLKILPVVFVLAEKFGMPLVDWVGIGNLVHAVLRLPLCDTGLCLSDWHICRLV
jgi:hypothetical protein